MWKKYGEMESVCGYFHLVVGFLRISMICHSFWMISHHQKALRAFLWTSQRPLAEPWWSLGGLWGDLVVLQGTFWAPWDPVGEPLGRPWGHPVLLLGDFGHRGTP